MEPTVTLLKKDLDDLIDFKEKINSNHIYVETYHAKFYNNSRWIRVNALPDVIKEIHKIDRMSVDSLEKKLQYTVDRISELEKELNILKKKKKKRWFFF